MNPKLLNIKVNAPKNFLYLPQDPRGSKYFCSPEGFAPEPDSAYDIIVKNIGRRAKLLDVGCSSGYFGEFLRNHKECQVYGLEIDRDAVEYVKSRGMYEDVSCIDLEELQKNLSPLLEKGYRDFDVIVCADVLEHLKNVNDTFLSLLRMLKPGGCQLVTVPSINHVDIVYNLIRGRFNYGPVGILDNTHLRFFTKGSFMEWVNLLAQDHGLKLDIKMVGQTQAGEITEPDENTQKKIQQVLETILDLYKEIGEPSDPFVLQHIFRIIYNQSSPST